MKRIIVADDDEGVLALVKFSLEQEGYSVDAFSDGESAFNAIIKIKPDIVILDVIMPRLNGYEVCEKIREGTKTRLIPVIMLTSQSQLKDKITGMKLGADDYIIKPFNPYEVVTRVEAVIRRAELSGSANPLTGLPGNVVIEGEITKRVYNGLRFAVLYLDINNFKSYNDNYGFEKGDTVIKYVAEILSTVIESCGSPSDLVAHIGGDDFIVITQSQKEDALCQTIIRLFDESIVKFYNEKDGNNGYISAKDRKGVEHKFPIMRLRIGVVNNEYRELKHYGEVAEIATEVKNFARNEEKSSYFKDRRKS